MQSGKLAVNGIWPCVELGVDDEIALHFWEKLQLWCCNCVELGVVDQQWQAATVLCLLE